MKGAIILGIDSGIKKNGVGWVCWDGESILQWGNSDWKDFLRLLYWREIKFDFAVIEHFIPHSQVGNDSIENVILMGRIIEIIEHSGKEVKRLTRGKIKAHHLGKQRHSSGDDAKIRQVLKQKYPHLKLPTNDATSAFAVATCVTELGYEPPYYEFVQKKRQKRTDEERKKSKEKFEKAQINKAKRTLLKLNPELLK